VATWPVLTELYWEHLLLGWDNANLKHFIDICKEEIDAGHRPNGCFIRNSWKNLTEKFL
jgi:hypothetical protein